MEQPRDRQPAGRHRPREPHPDPLEPPATCARRSPPSSRSGRRTSRAGSGTPTGDSMGLEGRVALVTGGGRGIGRAVSLALAERRRRRRDQLPPRRASRRRHRRRVEELGRRAAQYHASVDSWEEDEAMVVAALDDFGGVDILVNNAGIASRGHSVVNTDPAEFERVWRIHTFGSFALSKLVLPSMRERPRGDIVMMSSDATMHMAGWSSPYNMAKAGARGARPHAGEGGAPQQHPRQRGRTRPGGDRDGAAAGEGCHGRRRHRHPERGTRRSVTCAHPRRWPMSSASWSRTPPGTSPTRSSRSTAAASDGIRRKIRRGGMSRSGRPLRHLP